MSVRSSQAITVEFTTSRFDTGAATNGDSTPTGTLIVNGTDNGASVTVTNIDTGRYKAAVTLPTLSVGDVVELSVAATVNSVAGKGIVWRDTKDIVIDSAGLADANMVKAGPTGSGTPQTARDLGLALPAAAPQAAGGLITSTAGSLDLDEMNVDIEAIQTSTAGLTFTVANKVDANTLSVGGVAQTGIDIGAAVTNIGVTSAALNKVADSRTITTGTGEANTYTSTAAADGTYHSISDSAGSIDFYYEATLPTTGGALTGVNWLGYVVGVVNTIKVYIYNWTNSGWDQVGSVVGIAGTVNMDSDFDATNDHTGTGANALKVRFRFSATGLTAATVKTDRLLFGYTVVPTFPANFSSLGITAAGKISEVVLVDTLTTYTGDTPQTGDSFARIGLAGVGLTNLGDTRIANLDATITSRSTLTQTQVTGGAYDVTNASCLIHLAASQHVIVDSGTVTTLTNLPSIPANWLTAAGINAGALNGKGDWMVSYVQPTGFLAANFATGIPVSGDLSATMKTSVQTAADAAITANSTIIEIEAETDGIAAIPTSNPTAAAIADAVLGRGVGNVEDTADAHSLATLILGTTEYKIEGSIWHIYKTDGTTLFVDKTLSVSSEGHITQVH